MSAEKISNLFQRPKTAKKGFRALYLRVRAATVSSTATTKAAVAPSQQWRPTDAELQAASESCEKSLRELARTGAKETWTRII